MSRLVILAPNWIGDAVMALPTIASVRQWQAHAHLAVAARQSVAPLFSMVPGIDAVVAIRGRGGWRDAWRTWADARTLETTFADALARFADVEPELPRRNAIGPSGQLPIKRRLPSTFSTSRCGTMYEL